MGSEWVPFIDKPTDNYYQTLQLHTESFSSLWMHLPPFHCFFLTLMEEVFHQQRTLIKAKFATHKARNDLLTMFRPMAANKR